MAYLEEAIIDGCKRGEPKFQELLYEKYAARMMAICARYAKTRFEAEDVFHEAFVKVFQNIQTYEQGSFEGWMKRIFVNTSINNFRRNQKHYNHEQHSEENEAGAAEEVILTGISAKELMAVIATLPEGYRMVFNLYVVEGYTHKEIGEMLNIAEGTSKSQLAKAKAQLKKMLSNFSHPVYANR